MATVLAGGALFDGRVDATCGPAEVLVDDDRIVEAREPAARPPGAEPADGASGSWRGCVPSADLVGRPVIRPPTSPRPPEWTW